MATESPTPTTVRIEDLEYLHHGGAPLLARRHQPPEPDPFPLVAERNPVWALERGELTLRWILEEAQGFVKTKPDAPATAQAIEAICRFVQAPTHATH